MSSDQASIWYSHQFFSRVFTLSVASKEERIKSFANMLLLSCAVMESIAIQKKSQTFQSAGGAKKGENAKQQKV
uniref:Uncharacterized protein n=1 Tax=Ditylenchus dipsaci TaxID=166011 RepID=A0A915D492_9BILA